MEAVLNGTTEFILRTMESGRSYEEGLADAKARGLTETDPSLDVDCWDAANKLVIVANAVLRQPTTLKDVTVEGISNPTVADLRQASTRGERIVLLASASGMILETVPPHRPPHRAAVLAPAGAHGRRRDGHRLSHRHRGKGQRHEPGTRSDSHGGGDATRSG